MLVNVHSHMMFRPELIYIFDLIVNLMNKLKTDIWTLKNRNTTELLTELHNTTPQYSAYKIYL